MFDFIAHNNIPVLADIDILVVGAGSAGCVASLAAALDRNCKVLLIERYGYAGGTSTQMLDTFYGFFTPGDLPRKVVGGIPDRVVDALDRCDAVFLRPNTYGAGTGVNYDPEKLKHVWDLLLAQAGVEVWLHCQLVDVQTDNKGNPVAAIVFTKSGFFRIRARRYIDASGDADLCHHAGIAYEKAGETETAQSMTTTFRMSNVDLERFHAAGGKAMLKEKMAGSFAGNRHDLPRKEGSAHAMNQVNCISTVAVKVTDRDALDFKDLTAAEVEGRRQAFAYERFFREMVPGYEQAGIIGMSHHIGVRETRRVYGEYRLTEEDCMALRGYRDAVFLCGAPIEDHRKQGRGEAETRWRYLPDGGAYQVPYRTLVPRAIDTVWVVGRCFSATHAAHASCRSMAQTMSMGQAAGLAAAQSLRQDSGARDIDINPLQQQLLRLGAILETPTQSAFIERQDWHKNRSRGEQ